MLDYFWLKLGPHELLFDRIQYGCDDDDHRRKGRFCLDELGDCRNLTGIRNRINNVIRYGRRFQNSYSSQPKARLPGYSREETLNKTAKRFFPGKNKVIAKAILCFLQRL